MPWHFCPGLQQIEVRIGSVDFTGTGKVLLDGNPLCNYLPAGNNDRTAFFECSPSLHGRYLTVQKLTQDYFETHELYFCKHHEEKSELNIGDEKLFFTFSR